MARMRRAWLALLVVGTPWTVQALVPEAPFLPQDAPSGLYLEGASFQLFRYDNQTGLLTPAGESAQAVCVGVPEERVFVAGLCVDIDPTSQEGDTGFDAAGVLASVGDWVVSIDIVVGSTHYPPCTPACYTEALPQVTYYQFQTARFEVCAPAPGPYTLPAAAAMVAFQPHTGLFLEARDTTQLPCDGRMTICHVPQGNPGNRETLRILEPDWHAHQAHGDTLGACPA